MDKTALVTVDVTQGVEIIRALDKAHLKPSVVLWLHSSDYSDWRFVLSDQRFDSESPSQA